MVDQHWRVRVLLFTVSPQPQGEQEAIQRMADVLTDHYDVVGRVTLNEEVVRQRRALGAEFVVTAPTMGKAADRALELVQSAFQRSGLAFRELYELTIWPPRLDEQR